MPSFVYTPAQMSLAGGEVRIEPVRFIYSPGSLAFAGGDVEFGPSLSLSIDIDAFQLDRLNRAVAISDSGLPSFQFQALWQRNCEATEQALIYLSQQVDILSSIVAGLQAAQQAAAQANQGVEQLNSGVSLSSSRTEPVDGLLTATSGGVIAISAHQRVYTTGSTETRVNVSAGALSGFASGQFVRVFYRDTARAGGSVAYEGTTEEVTQVGDVHVVGGVAIPQAGDPPAVGPGTTPPGYVRGPGDGTQLN